MVANFVSFLIGNFKQILSGLFDQIGEAYVRRLLYLTTLAGYGKLSQELQLQFKGLGILHLLVLSGSQVSHFRRPLRLLERCIWGPQWQSSRSTEMSRRIFAFFSLCLYGSCVGWPAPLTRALVLESLRISFPRFSALKLCVLAFGLQLGLWPGHGLEMGFYLSWLSFLMLGILQYSLRQESLRLLAMSVFSQLFWIVIDPTSFRGYSNAFRCIGANLGVAYLFENFLSPLLGFVLALVVCLALVPIMAKPGGWGLLVFLPALRGGGTLILVAVRAFMYTEGHDL